MKNVPLMAIASAAALALGASPGRASGFSELIPPPSPSRIPDRLCADRSSPWYNVIARNIGVRFNGEDRPSDVHEYCVSEGWIDVRARNALGKYKIQGDGRFVLERLFGRVEPYFKIEPLGRLDAPLRSTIVHDDNAAISAAEAKRLRKAAKRARQVAGQPAEADAQMKRLRDWVGEVSPEAETPAQELSRLEAENAAAPEWGAAVGARHERIKGLRRICEEPSPASAVPSLSSTQALALDYLYYAVRRDADKGDNGRRETREVAESLGINTDRARRLLYSLVGLGLAEVCDVAPLLWQITDAGASNRDSAWPA